MQTLKLIDIENPHYQPSTSVYLSSFVSSSLFLFLYFISIFFWCGAMTIPQRLTAVATTQYHQPTRRFGTMSHHSLSFSFHPPLIILPLSRRCSINCSFVFLSLLFFTFLSVALLSPPLGRWHFCSSAVRACPPSYCFLFIIHHGFL